jgi:organic hydroperoxide reductase OsmC/OhrA
MGDPTDSSESSSDPRHVHRYQTVVRWSGSTGLGYADYDRRHTGGAAPATTQLALSADPAFGGHAELLNTEQLLVMAASSCQMLSFLAIAARARIDVVAYGDDATGEMPEHDSNQPMSIERIRLRPRIEIRGAVDSRKLARLIELAHHECYIANSLRSEVTVDPTVTFIE